MRINLIIYYLIYKNILIFNPWLKAKARRTTARKDRKRKWLTPFPERSGFNSKHPLPSSPNPSASLALIELRVSVTFIITSEKV